MIQTYDYQISPLVLNTLVHTIDYSGTNVGVYSSMTQMLSGGTGNTSLFTGLTLPILLTQDVNDLGYFSTFDGELSQINISNNFVYSATTGSPYTLYVYNTSDMEYVSYLQETTFTIDWGDNSELEVITKLAPEYVSHTYPTVDTGYTITIKNTGPFGTTLNSKKIVLPFVTNWNTDPNGEIIFTSNIGSWSATPVSYDYIFTGDSNNSVSEQVSSSYVPTPFSVSGTCFSNLLELERYGTTKYLIGVPVIKNGDVFGVVTEITDTYTAYTIQNINYVDFSDGETNYFIQSSGFTSDFMVSEPLVKEEFLIGINGEPTAYSDVFIDRGKNSALERIERLGEVNSVGTLEKYGYKFFNVENV